MLFGLRLIPHRWPYRIQDLLYRWFGMLWCNRCGQRLRSGYIFAYCTQYRVMHGWCADCFYDGARAET